MAPSRKVKKKVIRQWTEDDMTAALIEVKSSSKSIREVAKEYGLAESSLRFRIKREKEGEPLRKAGRKNVFSESE